MRYALIMAGGSGTRLWPMSRAKQPKQLIPFISGKSLLQLAFERLEGLVPVERRYICAGEAHRDAILQGLSSSGFREEQLLAEPVGRDTLNAVGYAAAVIGAHDSDAVIAVFTADHLIEPVDQFQQIVDDGFSIAQHTPHTLVTFGIEPTHAATGFGYLQLGDALPGESNSNAGRVVSEFKEKPVESVAQDYFDTGPTQYLWNSGMFVWRAATLMDCIKRYQPDNYDGLMRIADAWITGDSDATATEKRQHVLNDVYPNLKKISVDFAIMEPASQDDQVLVAALPMPLDWLDVGSWPAFAKTCETDEAGNAKGAGQHVLLDTKNTLIASSDPNHVIATLGCDDLIVIHTAEATLVCSREKAEQIKQLHEQVGKEIGQHLL